MSTDRRVPGEASLDPLPQSSAPGLAGATSPGCALEPRRVPVARRLVDQRTLGIALVAGAVAIGAGLVAQALTRLIAVVTNLAFFGRLSLDPVSPADHRLGAWVIAVPPVGGIVVGLLARYGSKAIRGHGIPEAMQQVLTNKSRIPARVTILKPLSAAVAIGTGGPFGAEGPIIATGGAMGSLVGQFLPTTAAERKTLLAAGAAAGMAATFGSPLAAVLLAVELLLFELSPRSLVPVSLAAATGAAVRLGFVGSAPMFPMASVLQPTGAALAIYALLGLLVGFAAVAVTRAVYAVEDQFERLPVHWMWWPALGAVAVGLIGWIAPRTLGVGYDNIGRMLSGDAGTRAVAMLCALKLVSWMVALGSGTSGGTLAPLFTIGGGLGATLGAAAVALAPSAGVDPRVAALVGMAAMFAGASRAVLASVVFAFEITREPAGILPLLLGCTSAFFASCLIMRNTIMSEKIARRGIRVVGEYVVDHLDRVTVAERCTRAVRTVPASATLRRTREWLDDREAGATHQGYPVVDDGGRLRGVVTRRDIVEAAVHAGTTIGEILRRPPAVVFEDHSLRQAADLMLREGVGRLPVVTRADPSRVVGIVTRSDLLSAHSTRLDEGERSERTRRVAWPAKRSPAAQ